MKQKMADLPQDRLECVAPFTNVGCDIFGPLYVNYGKSTRKTSSRKKVWVVIYCCQVIRCVHIDVIDSMDTTGFVNRFRRFIAIRGPCKILRTDNGSSLVAARKELLGTVDVDKVRSELNMHGCKWILHPPNASHFSGATGRLIGNIF